MFAVGSFRHLWASIAVAFQLITVTSLRNDATMLLDNNRSDMKIYDISVVDPQTQGEGRSMTTTYRVDVVSSVKNNTAYIRRRYSDFQWLYHRLQTERPGTILPMIPHKRAITQESRFSEELIGQRRVELEKFLKGLVEIPEIMNPVPISLLSFLTYESVDAFEEQKKELESTQPSLSSGDDMEAMSLSSPKGGKIRNMMARGVTAVGIMSGSGELESHEDDHEIEQMTTYIHGSEVWIKELLKHARILVQHTADRSTVMTDYGDATFGWLVTHREQFCPNSTNDTIETFRKVSEFFKYTSTLEANKGNEEGQKFEHSLVEMQRRIWATKIALGHRKSQLLTHTTRVKQLESRKAALSKIRVNGRVEKIRQAEDDLKTAEEQVKKSEEELDIVTKRVVREFNRIQPGLDSQLKKAVADYARIQIDNAKQAGDAWSKFLPHVEAKPETNGQPPMPTTAPPAPPVEEESLVETEAASKEADAPAEDPFANVNVPSLEPEKDLEVVGI